MKDKQCSECTYYERHERPYYSYCVRFPVKVPHKPTDWCGEWKKKKKEK